MYSADCRVLLGGNVCVGHVWLGVSLLNEPSAPDWRLWPLPGPQLWAGHRWEARSLWLVRAAQGPSPWGATGSQASTALLSLTWWHRPGPGGGDAFILSSLLWLTPGLAPAPQCRAARPRTVATAPALPQLAPAAHPMVCNLVLGGPKTSSNQNQLPGSCCFPPLPSARLCSLCAWLHRQAALLHPLLEHSCATARARSSAGHSTRKALLCSGTERCRTIDFPDGHRPQLRTSL